MPRGPAPPWRQRKEPVLDAYILASISEAGGKHHPRTGHYATLIIEGLESREQAREYIRALHRAGVHLTKYGIASVGISAKIIKRGKTYDIQFAAIDKMLARAHIIEKYGPDRSKWPYDPRRKGAA